VNIITLGVMRDRGMRIVLSQFQQIMKRDQRWIIDIRTIVTNQSTPFVSRHTAAIADWRIGKEITATFGQMPVDIGTIADGGL